MEKEPADVDFVNIVSVNRTVAVVTPGCTSLKRLVAVQAETVTRRVGLNALLGTANES